MIQVQKFFTILGILLLLTAITVTPAYAFEGRSGDYVTIEADDVIEDDLYVTAQVFTLDGTVTGDLVVAAQTIIINGEVGGDLFAGGQTVVINGSVADDVRIAGAGLQTGEHAVIGGDLVSAGASLETRDGSVVSGDLVVGAGQALLAGDVAGDVLAGSGGLELRGAIGSNIMAYVGESDDGAPPMNMYMTDSPITLPTVRPGLKVTDRASVAGNLTYSSTTDLSFPTGVVAGRITRTEPPVTETGATPKETNKVLDFGFDLMRSVVTLLLFGLLMVRFAPGFLQSLQENVISKFVPSLGWGIIAYAAFFFMLFVIIIVMILGGMIFGFLTLGSVTATIIFSALLALFAMILGFVLVTAFLTKISVGAALGKSIFSYARSPLAENKYWSLILGLLIIAVLVSLPFIGWLFGLVVLFLGLGAFWLWGRAQLARQPA